MGKIEADIAVKSMGGELSKHQGVLLTGDCSVHIWLTDFSFPHPGLLTWFELQTSHFCWILALQSVLWSFWLLLRGCFWRWGATASRTLKTPNFPPLVKRWSSKIRPFALSIWLSNVWCAYNRNVCFVIMKVGEMGKYQVPICILPTHPH